MKKYCVSHSETSKHISAERVWKIWTNVNSWASWDKGLEYASVQKNFCFAIGQTLKLKPVGVPIELNTLITDLKVNSFFKDKTVTPFGTVEVLHIIQETPDGISLTHQIDAFIFPQQVEFFENTILPKWKKEIPQSVKKIILKAIEIF